MSLLSQIEDTILAFLGLYTPSTLIFYLLEFLELHK